MAVDRRIDKKLSTARSLGIDVRPGATYGNWWRRLPTETRNRVLDALEQMPGERHTRRAVPVKRSQLRGGEHVAAKKKSDITNTLAAFGSRRVSLQVEFDNEPRFVSVKTMFGDLGGGEGAGDGDSGRNGEQLTDELQIWDDANGMRADDILDLADDYDGNILDALFAMWLATEKSG